ncbi:HEPN domain-containing protein [Caldivirga sp.]|uniref:HEPN domain-containing protein n=1 Tax=Caldivirga sp. TaxID=2080243 RepID=UPI0025BE7F23|nr:HEPN domain-containing protein [Caldivirga sp.]
MRIKLKLSEDTILVSHLEEYNRLMERSRRFMETAEVQIEKGFFDLAAFSLEQSLQSYLKVCLLRVGPDYPRTHSLCRLLSLIAEISGEVSLIELTRKFSLELGALEDAYITSRYIARDYDAAEVERLKIAVTEITRVLKPICEGG